MRLQKYMALCGVASRRKSEEMILQGRVKVNEEVIDKLGVSIEPERDIVKIDNKPIKIEKRKIYIILNKPVGYVTTVSDEHGRRKVLDLVQEINERIYPVGRLDYDSSGLLILTNDGDLAYKLTHPSSNISKKYIAKIKGTPTRDELDRFRKGIEIDGYVTAKARIDIIRRYVDCTIVQIEIHEGKNRQIRKMCEKINHPVIDLMRVEIGNIKIGKLKPGEWRHLSKYEVEYLKKL